MKQFRMGLLLGLGPTHSVRTHRKTFYLAFVLKSRLPPIPLFSTNLHAQNCAPVSWGAHFAFVPCCSTSFVKLKLAFQSCDRYVMMFSSALCEIDFNFFFLFFSFLRKFVLGKSVSHKLTSAFFCLSPSPSFRPRWESSRAQQGAEREDHSQHADGSPQFPRVPHLQVPLWDQGDLCHPLQRAWCLPCFLLCGRQTKGWVWIWAKQSGQLSVWAGALSQRAQVWVQYYEG